MAMEQENILHKIITNCTKGDKSMKRKMRIITSALAAIVVFSVCPINSFAMDTQELPENFKELSFEERFEWVSENVEAEYVQGEISNTVSAKTEARNTARTNYTARRSSGIKQAGETIYKFDVVYKWSVLNSDPATTIRIDSVNVTDYMYLVSYVRKDGPTVSKSVNTAVGIGQCEVHTGILASVQYYDLFQYATLYYNGGSYFREIVNGTS